ncbi:uroporphyrinogen decarboxylase family protein [Chloroflexota bacterium]
MAKTAEELYREREKRVSDAVQLKEPDRVPFMSMFHFFPAKYAGISFEQVMYDYDKLAEASKRVITDFEFDTYFNPFSLVAYGPLMEALDFKQVKWPGHGVSPDRAFQFVEDEYMTADEYDDFLSDPTDYMLRTYFPRVSGAMEPLKALPSMLELYYFRVLTGTSTLSDPDVAGALETLVKAGAESVKMTTAMRAFIKEMTDLGFPSQVGGVAYAPFDYIGDFFRGTRGMMLDMYRNPEKLIAAMEKILPVMVRSAITSAKRTGIPGVFIPLHKGHHGLMSLEQFSTFFWPTLQRLMLALIDEDLIPYPLFEGDYTSRLDIIKDIPAGKTVYWFEQTDVFKAKEVLGDRVCIRGNVPAPLLCTGTPQEVRDYCKKLIDIVGKGGGFIMDGGTGIPDEARIENVKAMADFTREYGVYK